MPLAKKRSRARTLKYLFGLVRAWLVAAALVPGVWLIGRTMSYRPRFWSLLWVALVLATVVYILIRATVAPLSIEPAD